MNRTNIDWADYSWNPIVGCDFGCKFCYAEKFCTRYKLVNDFKKPEFHPARLNDPCLVKKPSIIFVGSIAGIFSDGVKKEWIDQVIETIIKFMNFYPTPIF